MTITSGPLWPRFQSQNAITPVNDMSELAARLGSLVTFRRSGLVAYVDGFEDGLSPYEVIDNPAVTEVTIDTTKSFRGANSAKLHTTAVGGDEATLAKMIPLDHIAKAGFEVHFSALDDNVYFEISLKELEGANRYEAIIYVDITNREISYQDSAAAKVKIDDINLDKITDADWHALKLIVDFSTNTYHRLLIDDYEYSLEGIGMLRTNNLTTDGVLTRIRLPSTASYTRTLYIDDWILTIFDE